MITTVAGNGTLVSAATAARPRAPNCMIPTALPWTPPATCTSRTTLNNRIRKVSNGVITTVAGNGTAGFSGDNGPATSAQLYTPIGVAVDSAGNLFIADIDNFRIRKVSNGVITTVPGTAGSILLGLQSTPAAKAVHRCRQSDRQVSQRRGLRAYGEAPKRDH